METITSSAGGLAPVAGDTGTERAKTGTRKVVRVLMVHSNRDMF